jgi:PAS domain S-box-containing protein
MVNSHKWLLEENQTRLEHDRFIALLNSLNEGFIAVNDNGIIEISNSAALDFLDANILKGKNIFSVLHFIDQAGVPIDLAGKLDGLTDPIVNQTWQLKQHDGSLRSIYANIAPVKGYQGRYKGGFVILLRDVDVE